MRLEVIIVGVTAGQARTHFQDFLPTYIVDVAIPSESMAVVRGALCIFFQGGPYDWLLLRNQARDGTGPLGEVRRVMAELSMTEARIYISSSNPYGPGGHRMNQEGVLVVDESSTGPNPPVGG